MKLKSLKIKNYRSYVGEHKIDFDERFTAFIGKNDAGKSTVFDALDIFIGNKKPDISDWSVTGEEKIIEITAIFSHLPVDIAIDSSATTNLSDEYLLNSDGNLEIKKVFKCGASVAAPEVIIVANYPNQEQISVLHHLNNKGLKEMGEKIGVTVKDKKINHLWRKSIWESVTDMRTETTELKIEDFDTKAKAIYKKLEEYMPLVFVFRADREMTDSEAEAKDPMQIAVAEAQLALQSDIETIQNKIQERVDAVASLALEKLREMHPTLASQLKPVHKSKPKWSFDYKIEDDKGVALNKRGSGTRRLVLFNFFRAQAEQASEKQGKGIIYAIEEPETSQHPDNQILVMEALSELTRDPSRQVMITTHSPELLKMVANNFDDGIRFIQTDEDENREIISDKSALPLAAKALGILSKQMFGAAEKVVLVEGKGDCFFLSHSAKVMKNAGEITQTLEEAKVALLPVGGCHQVMQWVESEKYKELGFSTFVFLDSDRESSSEPQTKSEILISELKDPLLLAGFVTKRREIENYINPEHTGVKYSSFDDAKLSISIHNNISQKQVIFDYWEKITADDMDEEIKAVIRQILN